jgi:menaquinone-specific isochorismate synthase
MAEKIEEALGSSVSGIKRISIGLDSSISPLKWLKSAKADSKIYWSDRAGEFQAAGAGECLLLAADNYEQVEGVVASAARLVQKTGEPVRIYGGIRFPTSSKNSADSDWRAFQSCRFVIPRFEITKNHKQTVFVCNLKEGDFADIQRILRELDDCNFNDSREISPAADIVSRIDQPTFDGWEGIIKSVIRDFSKGKIEKIVLARQSTFKFKERCDALNFMERLSSATPRCYHFYFQPQKDVSFLGASPERLYSRNNRVIESEALAGTRPRGETAESDIKLGEDLLHNEKELREHRYVVDNIKAALGDLCENYSVEKAATLLKLARLQHLQTEFKGKLRTDVSESEIINALHPTSAVFLQARRRCASPSASRLSAAGMPALSAGLQKMRPSLQ